MKMFNRSTHYLFVSTVLLTGAANINALASTNEWQPVSAESLIELPANLIEKRIQQDFNMSPMASELMSIEESIAEQSPYANEFARNLAKIENRHLISPS